MNNYETLTLKCNDALAIITLNRPSSANGINTKMAQELLTAATYCEEHGGIRAILLSANGKMFSAGGDLKDFASFGDDISSKIKELMVYLHSAISRFTRMDIPVVIAVNGMAAGAGFSLACAGDIVYAAQSARFMMAYTNIGLSPDGGSSFFLPRLIGMRRTQELMLTNRILSAKEALDWGIITQVIDDEKLYEAALATATALAQGPTKAYAQVKKLLLNSSHESLESQLELEARGMGAMSRTADGKNGIAAFLNKEKPTFSGN